MAGGKGRSPGLEQKIAEASSRASSRKIGMTSGMGGGPAADADREKMRQAMAGQRIGAPRTMPRAGVNTRQAAPRKNKRGTSRG